MKTYRVLQPLRDSRGRLRTGGLIGSHELASASIYVREGFLEFVDELGPIAQTYLAEGPPFSPAVTQICAAYMAAGMRLNGRTRLERMVAGEIADEYETGRVLQLTDNRPQLEYPHTMIHRVAEAKRARAAEPGFDDPTGDDVCADAGGSITTVLRNKQ